MTIKDKKLSLIWKASGYMDAQIVKNYLESFGIEVFDFEESVGKSYGFTNAPLGEVELYVRPDVLKQAKEYLQAYLDSGESQNNGDVDQAES